MGLGRYRINDNKFYFEEIFIQISSFKDYIDNISDFIEKEQSRVKEKYTSFLELLKEEPWWEGEVFEHRTNYKIKEKLADIFFDSVLISIHSFFEKKLSYIAHSLSEKNTITLNGHVKNIGNWEYRKYLNKNCNISFDKIEKEWNRIMLFSKLRNVIVHYKDSRTISSDHKDYQVLIDFLKNQKGITIKVEEDKFSFKIENFNVLISFLGDVENVLNFIYIEKK